MATDQTIVPIERESPETVQSTIGTIKKMLLVGGLFAAVGYLLIIGALVLELTQFHPLIDSFFQTYPSTSLAGGGPNAARPPAASSRRSTSSPRRCCG